MDECTHLSRLHKLVHGCTRADTGVHHQPGEPPRLWWALEYLALGWCPVPLCPPDHAGPLPPTHLKRCKRHGKTPTLEWKHLQERFPTDSEVRSWWAKNPALNVGIVLGRVSGLVGIDVDGPEGEAELRRLCGGTIPATLRFTTPGGGFRLLFAWDRDTPSRTTSSATGAKPVHFQGYGSLTVAPPSGHASGGEYRWVPESFEALARLPAVPDCLTHYFRPGAARPERKTNQTTSGGGCVGNRDRLMARVSAWVANKWPSVEGEYGSGDLFHLCCALVHGFGLGPGVARDFLVNEYNRKCQPPWSEKEIDHTLGNAIKNGSYRDLLGDRAAPSVNGTAFSRPAAGPTEPPPPPPRVAPAAASVTRPPALPIPISVPAAATPSSPTDTPAAATPPPLPGRLASSLVETPIEWLLEPYIRRATFAMLIGEPESGKSTFLTWLMTLARRVVLLPGFEEDPDRDVLPRLRAFGVDPDNVLVLDKGDWSLPNAEGKLVDVITRFGADGLFCDCIDNYMADDASENLSQDVRPFLEAWTSIAMKTKAAVVANRHPGKDPRNVNPGSRAWRAVPRVIDELTREAGPPEQFFISVYKGRGRGPAIPPRQIELVRSDSGLETLRIGRAVDPETVELARQSSDSEEQEKVARAMELIPLLLANGEMDAKDVYTIGQREALGDRVMDRAARRYGVVRRREGNGKNHRCFWSLPKRDADGS